jgi:uncharacterized membrane protein
MASPYRHPVNRKLLDNPPFGARIADQVTSFLGSWRFILIQTVVVAIWILGNVYLYFYFDPYPFILLNLAFSTQAAYAAPLILLAGNRAAVRDRLTLEHASDEADKEDRQNQRLLHGNKEILERNTEILARVQRLEERILSLEQRIVGLLGERDGGTSGSGSPG